MNIRQRALGRRLERRAADPDAAPLRRVRWRLAAITVGLLTALLVALSGAIYVATEHVLMDSLHATLRARADAAIPHFRFQQSGPLYGAHRDGGGVCVSVVGIDIDSGSVTAPNDTCNPDAQTLPDPSAAQHTLQDSLAGHFGATWSSQQVDTSGPYLIYTKLLVDPIDGSVQGVAQFYLSEQQYLNDLHLLLQVLAGASLLGVAASAAISYWLSRRALQPVRVAMQRQRDFVADAAHELRTPLAIMRTAAELGLSNGEAMDQEVALEQTLAQNAHLTQLVDSLLLLARADSGTMTLERQPIDLGNLVRETAASIAVLAEEREVRLDVRATEDLRVLGDAGRLRQLLLILLDNALKHTPDGGSIMIGLVRAGNRAQLTVQDTGPGIDPPDLPHIFDRFYRADRARAGEGVGLGLAIGRWIVEAHGGRIAAANAPAGGAIFTVTLPLAT
jgi:signal transduction histidine kinase